MGTASFCLWRFGIFYEFIGVGRGFASGSSNQVGLALLLQLRQGRASGGVRLRRSRVGLPAIAQKISGGLVASSPRSGLGFGFACMAAAASRRVFAGAGGFCV